MASTINADNGVVSGSSGVKTTADTSGVLALQSNGTTGLTLDTNLNVGIGVTPSNAAGYTTLDLSNASNGGRFRLLVGSTPYGVFYTNGTTDVRLMSAASVPLLFGTNYNEYLRIGTAGQIGLSGANYGTSGQVLTSAGSGAAPTWETPSAPVAGKLLASGNIDSSTGLATFSWATTGVKRLQVYLAGAFASVAGNIRIQVGDTTSIVTASNYRVQCTEFDNATIFTGTASAATSWTLSTSSTTNWPCQMSAEIGLNGSGLPSMLGRFGRIGSAENTLCTGDFNGTWSTAQFQSIQVTITGGSTYSGRVTVIGYTE